MERNTTTATLRDYLRIIFRRKMLLVIVVIPMLIINYVVVDFNTRSYVASVKLFLKEEKIAPPEQYQMIYGGSELFLSSQDEILKSTRVIEPVVRALKLYELPEDREREYASPIKKAWLDYIASKISDSEDRPQASLKNKQGIPISRAIEEWKGKVSVLADQRTTVFTIAVEDYNGALAAKVANALSRSYLIFDLEQQIAELKLKYGDMHSTVKQMEDFNKNLRETLDDATTPDIGIIPSKVKILEWARVIPQPVKSKTSVLVFALFAGLLVGLTLIVVFEYFDPTIKSPRDIETVLDTGLLGSVPKIKSKNKLINSSDVNPDYLRSYKELADNIYLIMKNNHLKSVLITDADNSGDTSNIVANLGIYLSHHEGNKVLIVDANLRSQGISEIFDISNNGNLVDVIEKTIPCENAIKDVGSNLYILPAGKPSGNPSGLLNSENMIYLTKTVSENFDLVFFYCADLKNFKDSVILSSFMDAIILVVNEGRTHQQVIKHIMQPLKLGKANLIGAILNDRTYVIPSIIYKLT